MAKEEIIKAVFEVEPDFKFPEWKIEPLRED